MMFASASRTHVGLVRKLNEDAHLVRPEVGLWAVADGMGGHQAGDVASALLREALSEVDAAGSGAALLDEVRAAVQRVNRALLVRAAAMGPGAVIGSTVAVLTAHEGRYACLWAGDSRVYLLREGTIAQVTTDHSVVQELIDAGAVSPEEARRSPRSNVITRAVGVVEGVALDLRQGRIEPGDTFVLCSDGLTGHVDDPELLAAASGPDLEAAADALLALTLERGARDNVTLVLVAVLPDAHDALDQTLHPHG